VGPHVVVGPSCIVGKGKDCQKEWGKKVGGNESGTDGEGSTGVLKILFGYQGGFFEEGSQEGGG